MMTIAIVAGDPTVRQTVHAALSGRSYALIDHEASALESSEALSSTYALCIALRGEADLATISSLRSADPDLPVIGLGAGELTARALEAGAYDYVPDPLDAATLLRIINRAVERRQLTRKVQELSSGQPGGADAERDEVVPLRELERQAIARALKATKGSVTKAAKLLGIGRATLYRRLASPEMASLRPRRGYEPPPPRPTALPSVSHAPLAQAGDPR